MTRISIFALVSLACFASSAEANSGPAFIYHRPAWGIGAGSIEEKDMAICIAAGRCSGECDAAIKHCRGTCEDKIAFRNCTARFEALENNR